MRKPRVAPSRKRTSTGAGSTGEQSTSVVNTAAIALRVVSTVLTSATDVPPSCARHKPRGIHVCRRLLRDRTSLEAGGHDHAATLDRVTMTSRGLFSHVPRRVSLLQAQLNWSTGRASNRSDGKIESLGDRGGRNRPRGD